MKVFTTFRFLILMPWLFDSLVRRNATGLDTHSLIWRPSRVADTPPLLPISRYGYCLFVADVCLCSEVLQPGGSWSSSGSGSM